MRALSSLAICAAVIGARPNETHASPQQAFEDFENACLELTDGEPTDAFASLSPASARETEVFKQFMKTEEDWIVWYSNSPEFVVITYQDSSDFCQVFGLDADFSEVKGAYDRWSRTLGPDFIRSDMEELDAKGRASALLIRQLGDLGVQQITMHHSEWRKPGFTSLLVVRLDELSPMAKKLLADAGE